MRYFLLQIVILSFWASVNGDEHDHQVSLYIINNDRYEESYLNTRFIQSLQLVQGLCILQCC